MVRASGFCERVGAPIRTRLSMVCFWSPGVAFVSISPSTLATLHPTLSSISTSMTLRRCRESSGLTIDENGLAGRECHLQDLDGNRLRIATPRS